MMWRHVLQNILALVGMVVLIVTGNAWWSLLLLFFVIIPGGRDKCPNKRDSTEPSP